MSLEFLPAASHGVRLERNGRLIDRAARLLGARPMHTLEVAQAVLGIRGNPPIAARVVFTLLGDDPRFRVDGGGYWSLAGPESALDAFRMLAEEDWVVVDLETTGGSPGRGHRVTEVGIVRVAGRRIRETYSTLVNPQRAIPGFVTSLTGITEPMVRDAPLFRQIAPEVARALEGHVFVAHNAGFDWRFLCMEMELALGSRLSGRRLCTVRVARHLLPQLTSRSLDALADFFGVEIASRHRALDDALATAEVLLRFLQLLEERSVRDWEALERLLRKRAPRRKRRATPTSMPAA